MAEALVACHEKGILHRDLKPSNVLFDPATAGIKVIDFGVAQVSLATGLDAVGSVVGTPEYMAPEQFGDIVPDPRSDLYSTGVLLYEAATGRRPITGRTLPQVVRAHQQGVYPRPREIAPTIGEGAEMVILRLMAKDPAERFQTAEEFASFLSARGSRETSEIQASSPACPACSSPRESGLPFCPMCGVSLEGFDRSGRWAVRVRDDENRDRLAVALNRLLPDCAIKRPSRSKSSLVLDFASEPLARWVADELRREGIGAGAIGPDVARGFRNGKLAVVRSVAAFFVALSAGPIAAVALLMITGVAARLLEAGAVVSPLPASGEGAAPLAKARSAQARLRGSRYKAIGRGLIVSTHRMNAARSPATERGLPGADPLLEASFDLLEAMDIQARSLFELKETEATRRHRKDLVLRGSHVLLRLTTLWRSRARAVVRSEVKALARGLKTLDQTKASLKDEHARIRAILTEMKALGSSPPPTRSALS
jgi:hypothetical protein